MDRSLLPQKVLDEFPAAYQAKILAMMKDRATVEARAGDMTPENLAHWIGQGKNERVRAFIASGVDVNTLGKSSGDRPLHLATAMKFTKMVELLVEAGANVNAEATEQGIPGLTPTQIADDQGYGELAAYLRSKGGKVNHGFLVRRAAQRAFTNAIGPFLQQH